MILRMRHAEIPVCDWVLIRCQHTELASAWSAIRKINILHTKEENPTASINTMVGKWPPVSAKLYANRWTSFYTPSSPVWGLFSPCLASLSTIRTRSVRAWFAQFPVGMDHVERYPGTKRLQELMLHLLQTWFQLSTFNIIVNCILYIAYYIYCILYILYCILYSQFRLISLQLIEHSRIVTDFLGTGRPHSKQ